MTNDSQDRPAERGLPPSREVFDHRLMLHLGEHQARCGAVLQRHTCPCGSIYAYYCTGCEIFVATQPRDAAWCVHAVEAQQQALAKGGVPVDSMWQGEKP